MLEVTKGFDTEQMGYLKGVLSSKRISINQTSGTQQVARKILSVKRKNDTSNQ
jgi:hypothetical protein